MKISYISNSRIPTEKAHGLQIIRMCEAFANNGHHLQLIVPNRFNPIKKDVFEFYNSKNNFKIKFLPIIDTVSLGKFGFIFESIQFAVTSTIYSLFKKSKLVFTRDEILAAFNILIGKKVYWESHTGAYGFFAKFVLKKADKIIVISEGLKDFYKEKGVSEDRMVVAHDGVDLEEFKIEDNKEFCREKLNLPKDKKIILYTGHLYGWKGVYTLADSANFFNEDYLFVFVGGTLKDIDTFKNLFGKEKNIIITGHRDHCLIPYYLKSADALVIPNSAKTDIGSKFTSPLKLFEYMASGTPIIASDVPAIKEILNQDAAVFFEADNVSSLVSSIKSLLEDDYLLNNLSQRALSEVSSYTWLSRVKNILN